MVPFFNPHRQKFPHTELFMVPIFTFRLHISHTNLYFAHLLNILLHLLILSYFQQNRRLLNIPIFSRSIKLIQHGTSSHSYQVGNFRAQRFYVFLSLSLNFNMTSGHILKYKLLITSKKTPLEHIRNQNSYSPQYNHSFLRGLLSLNGLQGERSSG